MSCSASKGPTFPNISLINSFTTLSSSTTAMATISIEEEVSYDTHSIYNVHFFSDNIISTLVTHDPEMAADWLTLTERLHHPRLDRLVVGIDTEWRPSFSRITNPVAILQICVGRRCLIYQILRAEAIPDKLHEFLANEEYTFVGVGIENDVERLAEDHSVYVRGRLVDLPRLAADVYDDKDLKNAGLRKLAMVVLDRSVDKAKSVTMGKWDNLWLNHLQVQYACIDAFVSFEIGKRLNAWRAY